MSYRTPRGCRLGPARGVALGIARSGLGIPKSPQYQRAREGMNC